MHRTPRAPLYLGAAGLIPFAGLALLCWAPGLLPAGFGTGEVRRALGLYGAIIASFLGGIRWGLAVGRPAETSGWYDYTLSVVPSLLAWAALALSPSRALIALGVLVVVWGVLDQDLVRRAVTARWFGRLRLALSAGAGLLLIAAGIAP